jgi:(2S)-methylsuccinyl-CoA dehydrogenase
VDADLARTGRMPGVPSQFIDQAQALIDISCRALKRRCTANATFEENRLDAFQSVSYAIAFCAAEIEAARQILAFAAAIGSNDSFATMLAEYFAADALHSVRGRLLRCPADFGFATADTECLAAGTPLSQAIEAHLCAANCEELGHALLERRGRLPIAPLTDEHSMIRETFKRFAEKNVAPLAEGIHRDDMDIPDEMLSAAAEIGLFAVCIPQRYGGLKPDGSEDTLSMILVSEELSRVSLGVAGSLLTRPEIVARALLAEGTQAQQQEWLPRLATGEILAAVAVTEPNFGSDVAGVRLRATRTARGWLLDGQKTWCTFAGKAAVLLVLARTDPELAKGHRGLTLFIVEKPRFPGHGFKFEGTGGGRLTGKAIPTIGYRGMHSFDLYFDSLFVPDSHVVGGTGGIGRGFYATMQGFAGGRIQTAARATGVMQGAYERAFAYATQRRVFGKTIAEYPLALSTLVRMAALLVACREFSHSVAKMMDRGQGQMQASLVKLFACRTAEWVTREAMQIHGGVGYAEASDVSRFYVDARVLSIFEGAEETLALKVIGRDLIRSA